MTKKKSGSGFQLGTILALVIMCVFLAISNSNFYSPSNIMGIFKQTAFNGRLSDTFSNKFFAFGNFTSDRISY